MAAVGVHDRHSGWPVDDLVRVRLDEGEVHFWDALAGDCVQHPAQQCGDIAVIDRNGCWTYQFAVVVDDLRHGINLVIRGEDIAPSTGRQLALGRLLGMAAAPVYLHHGLLTDATGRKLSKRDFDADIHSLFLAGTAGAAVLGQACHMAGLLPGGGPLSADALPGCFQANPRA